MIADRDKILIRRLVFSEEWKIVQQVIDEIKDDIMRQSKVADSQWDTARNAVEHEGQIKGILRLIDKLNDLASQVK